MNADPCWPTGKQAQWMLADRQAGPVDGKGLVERDRTAMAGMSRRWRAAGLLLLLGLFLRAGLNDFLIRRERARLPDSVLYESYAETIFDGQPYRVGGDRARRAPGYPVFLALCWRVAGGKSDRAVLWAQAVVAMLGGAALYGLGCRLETRGLPTGTAIAALLFLVLDPYAVVLSSMILSETVFTALLVLAALIGAVAGDQDGWQWPALLGITSAAAVLVRPSGLLLVPLAGVLWLALANEKKRIAFHLLAGGLGFLMVLSPWWIRNADLFGRFVPVTLNVGESLYDGLNPRATGASDMTFERDPRVRNRPEIERDRIWRTRAEDWALRNPGRVVQLAAIKFWRFWSPWPNGREFRSPLVLAVTTLGTVPIWILALWAAWAFREQRGLLLLCLLPAAYFCVLHMIFVSSVRYRVPAMPLMGLLAGAGLMLLVGHSSSSVSSEEPSV